MRDVDDHIIKFALYMASGPDLDIMDYAWESMMASPPKGIVVSVLETVEERAIRKSWIGPRTARSVS